MLILTRERTSEIPTVSFIVLVFSRYFATDSLIDTVDAMLRNFVAVLDRSSDIDTDWEILRFEIFTLESTSDIPIVWVNALNTVFPLLNTSDIPTDSDIDLDLIPVLANESIIVAPSLNIVGCDWSHVAPFCNVPTFELLILSTGFPMPSSILNQ